MIVGQKELEKNLIRLSDENKLSHSYIFFGEPQVGKFSFARHLANYIEYGKFESPTKLFQETLIVDPNITETPESIGIDTIRNLKHFLYEKPVSSPFRKVIINDAHLLTDQAQNAILKIAEEPPEHGLIIMIVQNPEALLLTLQSRFQKIYFPRTKQKEIEKMLINSYDLTHGEAKEISSNSFGRPGRAIDLAKNEKVKEEINSVKKSIKTKAAIKTLIGELVEDRTKVEPTLGYIIAELSKDIIKNHRYIKSIINRLRLIQEFNTNRRLQLESALYKLAK